MHTLAQCRNSAPCHAASERVLSASSSSSVMTCLASGMPARGSATAAAAAAAPTSADAAGAEAKAVGAEAAAAAGAAAAVESEAAAAGTGADEEADAEADVEADADDEADEADEVDDPDLGGSWQCCSTAAKRNLASSRSANTACSESSRMRAADRGSAENSMRSGTSSSPAPSETAADADADAAAAEPAAAADEDEEEVASGADMPRCFDLMITAESGRQMQSLAEAKLKMSWPPRLEKCHAGCHRQYNGLPDLLLMSL